MNRQIVTLVMVVLLGVGAGLWIVSRQEQKAAGTSPQGQDQVVRSMKDLRSSIDQLTAEIKALRETVPTQPGAAAAKNMPTDDYDTVFKIDVAHSTIIGNKNAPVTIVEFMDFQCPYCGRFHPALEEVIKQYPDQVNYVIKNYPLQFHPNARPAAKAAFAAGEQGKYAEMSNLLIKNQDKLGDETYKNLAKELGLDVEKFEKDLKEKDAQWESYIQQDMDLANKVGVRGTPTFFINGKKTRARTADQYKQEIDAILKTK